MELQLTPHTHFCVASDQVVFLDLRSDRYLALPDTLNQSFGRLTEGAYTVEDLEVLSPLVSRGLLAARSSQTRAPEVATAPRVSRSALDFPRIQIRMSDTLEALYSYYSSARALTKKGLASAISGVEQSKSKAEASADRRPLSPPDLMAFLAARKWISTQDQCLRNALALVRYMARRRYFPELVVGVRMRPFHAHAWVQDGDLVLNDEVDTVVNYTPILVV